jgi:PKD repeat protein
MLNSILLFSQPCNVNITSSSLTFCAGGSVKLKATGGLSGSYVWSNGATTDSIIVTPTASTTFSVVGTCNTGTDNASVNINLVNPPVAAFNSTPNTPCANTPIVFTNTTVSATGYLWNFGDPLSGSLNSVTTQNSSHSFSSAIGSGTQNYNVTLTAYGAPGCTSSVTNQVTVKQRPDALLKYFDEDLGVYNESRTIKYCRASSYLLDIINHSTTISTNTAYNINWGDGAQSFSASTWAADSSITHTYPNFGYFNLLLTANGPNGCSDTTSYSIYNGSNPRLIFNLAPNEPQAVNVCTPDFLDFVASDFQNNDPATIYILTSNYDSIQTSVVTHASLLANPNFSFMFDTTSCGASGSGSGSSFTPNSYYVQLVAKNGCSELPKQYGPITTSMKPEAKYSGDTIACINKEVKFTNTSDYGVAVNGNGICDTTNKFHWKISPSIGWGPATGANNVISPGNQLGNTNPSNNPATWGSRTLRVNFTTQGQYTVSIIVANTCGSDTFTQVICIEPPPTPIMSNLTLKTGCAPFTITPKDNSPVLSAFCKPVERKWIVTRLNGVCSADSAVAYRFTSGTSDTSKIPSIKFNNQGTYLLKLRLKNSCDTFVVADTIKIKTKPKFTLANINNACGDYKVKPSSTTINCGNNPLTYSWSFSGGVPSSSTSEQPDSVLFSGVGTHTVALSVTNECGTTNEDTTFVIANPPIAEAGIGETLCEGETIQLSGSATQGSIPYVFSWTSNPVGFTSSQQNPSTTASQNIIFSLTVTDAGNCTSTDVVTYSVIPAPVLTVNSPSICSGDSVQLIVSGGTGYLWSTGSTSSTITVSPTSSTSYTVSASDSGSGCSGDEVSTVTVNQSPNVDAGPNIIACSQPVPTILTGFSPAGGTWTGTGVSSTGEFQSLVNDTYTLYYFYQDQTTGCSKTDSMTVTVVSPQIADAGLGFSICANAATQTLTGFAPTGGTWTGTSIIGNNFNPTTAGTGNLVLTYSFGSESCLTQDTIHINVLTLPNLIVNSAAICSGKPAILVATGADTYSWNTGETNDSITVSPPTAQDFTVTGTDTISGCIVSQVSNVTVNNLPVVSFTNVINGCENTAISFNNATQNASGFLWDFGDTNTSTDTQPQHVFADTGTYQIQLIATSGAGCVDSSFGTIRVFDFPQTAFTLSAQEGCAPLSIDYTNQTTGMDISFSWNLGNSLSTDTIPLANIYQQGNSDTSYVITLTTTNFCGSSIKQDTILVKPKPVASFGTNINEGCSPLPIFFSNNSAGNATQYIWDFGDGSPTSNAVTPTVHTFTTGDRDTTYIITLVGINACGTDTIQRTVLIHPNTVNAFFNTNPTTGCAPLNVTFVNFSTGGSFFSWNFGDGNVSSIAAPTNNYQNPGTYTCSLYVNNGCSFDTISQVITVNPPPTVSFVPSVPAVCAKSPISFINNSINCINFNWNFGDTTATSTLTNPQHTYQNSGTYTVTLTGTSTTFGCNATYTMALNVKSLPIPIIDSDTTFGCAPLVINFQNLSQNANFYTWYFGDGNTTSSVSPTNIYVNTGTYTVKLKAENLSGCIDSTTYSINVFDVPTAGFTISSNFTCSVPVQISTTNTSVGATSYFWDFGNGVTSTLNAPLITYLTFEQDTIMLIASNSYGCKDTVTDIFYSVETPQVNFIANPDTGCQPLRVAFQNLTQFATSYFWRFGDSLISTNMNVEHVYYDVGNYTVFLKASNQFCSDSITKNNLITVYPKPSADFTFNQIYIDGLPNGTIQFTDNSQDAVSYHWYFGDNEESEEINPLHQYPGYNNYFPSLVITNAFGCLDTITKLVVPDYFEGLFVPNALMPNSPAAGDSRVFLPKGKSLKEYHLQIFNSYGILIFESRQLDINGSPTEGWDGIYKGIQCQQDAYVWEIEASFIGGKSWQGVKSANGKFKKTGTLTLVK